MNYPITFTLVGTLLFTACNSNPAPKPASDETETGKKPAHEELLTAYGPISDEERAELKKLGERHPTVNLALLTGKTWTIAGIRATADELDEEERLNRLMRSQMGMKLFLSPDGTAKKGADLSVMGTWEFKADSLALDFEGANDETDRILLLTENELVLLYQYYDYKTYVYCKTK